MESFYKYVGEMSEEVFNEIRREAGYAVRVFNITDLDNGRSLATQIRKIVDNILETGKFPEEYESIVDVAVALGTVFGNALCVGYDWEWKELGENEEDVVHAVVSPKGYYSNAPMVYLYRILTGNNIGLDGKNDNTVLLLYNMLENIDDRPEDKMYIPMA